MSDEKISVSKDKLKAIVTHLERILALLRGEKTE